MKGPLKWSYQRLLHNLHDPTVLEIHPMTLDYNKIKSVISKNLRVILQACYVQRAPRIKSWFDIIIQS